jgi:hypothetical protein
MGKNQPSRKAYQNEVEENVKKEPLEQAKIGLIGVGCLAELQIEN